MQVHGVSISLFDMVSMHVSVYIVCVCVSLCKCGAQDYKDDFKTESLHLPPYPIPFHLPWASPLSLMRNRGQHGSVSNTQTEQIPWAWLLENRSCQIVDPILFQIPQAHWELQSQHTQTGYIEQSFLFLGWGGGGLVTLLWCAVKQHFNLIRLNNFLRYDALSFDCQGCLITWFYIWEIWIPDDFHFSGNALVKILFFWRNGYWVVLGSTGCALCNAPCINQSSMCQSHRGAQSSLPMGVQNRTHKAHFILISHTSFWEKPIETCCHMYVDW